MSAQLQLLGVLSTARQQHLQQQQQQLKTWLLRLNSVRTSPCRRMQLVGVRATRQRQQQQQQTTWKACLQTMQSQVQCRMQPLGVSTMMWMEVTTQQQQQQQQSRLLQGLQVLRVRLMERTQQTSLQRCSMQGLGLRKQLQQKTWQHLWLRTPQSLLLWSLQALTLRLTVQMMQLPVTRWQVWLQTLQTSLQQLWVRLVAHQQQRLQLQTRQMWLKALQHLQ
jgi:hypothetical protein